MCRKQCVRVCVWQEVLKNGETLRCEFKQSNTQLPLSQEVDSAYESISQQVVLSRSAAYKCDSTHTYKHIYMCVWVAKRRIIYQRLTLTVSLIFLHFWMGVLKISMCVCVRCEVWGWVVEWVCAFPTSRLKHIFITLKCRFVCIFVMYLLLYYLCKHIP